MLVWWSAVLLVFVTHLVPPQVCHEIKNGRTYVKGRAPCNPHPHLAPAPLTVAEFRQRVLESPEVVLLRVTNQSYLPDRQSGSSWEKIAVSFHKKIVMVEYDVEDTQAQRMAESLGVSSTAQLPYLHLFDELTPSTESCTHDAACAEEDTDGGMDLILGEKKGSLGVRLVEGTGYSHGQLRKRITARLQDLPTDTNGRHLKRIMRPH